MRFLLKSVGFIVDKRLFFLLNMAQHKMFQFADVHCEQRIGITVTQTAAMLFIAKNEGCLQKELSAALNLNNSAVTGLAVRMERNDLIVRKPCSEDGRASRVHLTETGRSKLPDIFPLIEELNQKLTADFSDDEIEVIAKFLNKIMTDFE